MDTPFPRDWIVSSVEGTKDRWYPYRVTGENLNHPPESPGRHFTWRIPSITWRYDCANARIDALALENMVAGASRVTLPC